MNKTPELEHCPFCGKSNETGWDLFYVSYWMPIPELPKEKE